ncbi:hypothetical protein [Shewanella indica]|uniref:hypothetical protein n=2 Tax=Shewanella TaxID=22 RepID=UPI001269DEAF
MMAVLIINGAFGIHINKGKCEQVPCVLCVGFQAGKNLSKVMDGVARIYGFELMQVAQALDLQKKVNHRQLSPQNEQLLKALRKQVVYPGVEASTQFLMKFQENQTPIGLTSGALC